MSTFEVDSIELATPELFSNDKEPKIFEDSNSEKVTETKDALMILLEYVQNHLHETDGRAENTTYLLTHENKIFKMNVSRQNH